MSGWIFENGRVAAPRFTRRGWEHAKKLIQEPPKDLEVPGRLAVRIAENDDPKIAVRRERNESREPGDTTRVQ